MTPVIRDKVSMIKGMLSTLKDGDVTISQSMEIQKTLVDSRWGSKDSPTQIMFANVHIEKTVNAAIRLLDDIIDYREPLPFEKEQTINGLIQELCVLAFDSGRTWKWLRNEVVKGFVMEAERHHPKKQNMAGSIDMDRTTLRKYLT